ncbi:MAG: hypothetical protein J5964_03890 [Eubacterium sp.]|nr:hypothetical protein [Eubacterium sp.]
MEKNVNSLIYKKSIGVLLIIAAIICGYFCYDHYDNMHIYYNQYLESVSDANEAYDIYVRYKYENDAFSELIAAKGAETYEKLKAKSDEKYAIYSFSKEQAIVFGCATFGCLTLGMVLLLPSKRKNNTSQGS